MGETEEGWGALPYYERITDLMNPFSKPLPQFFHSGCNIMLINWRFTNLYSVLINHLNKAFDKLTQHYVHIVKMWASKI